MLHLIAVFLVKNEEMGEVSTDGVADEYQRERLEAMVGDKTGLLVRRE